MFDENSQPLYAEQAREARSYFGMSQAKVAELSGLPAHVLKRFESPGKPGSVYIPDDQFLVALRRFYEARGYVFKDTPKPGERAKETGQVVPAGVVGEIGNANSAAPWNKPPKASFHHMRIALTDADAMGRILDVIEDNEERAQDLLKEPIEGGFFGGLSEQCQARHGEAVSLLAENGRLFAMLFGRTVGGDVRPEILAGKERPSTQADLMHKRQADASLWALQGNQEARQRKKSRKPAGSLLTAIFG